MAMILTRAPTNRLPAASKSCRLRGFLWGLFFIPQPSSAHLQPPLLRLFPVVATVRLVQAVSLEEWQVRMRPSRSWSVSLGTGHL